MKKILGIGLFSFLAFSIHPAFSDTGQPPTEEHHHAKGAYHSCDEDIQKYCQDKTAGPDHGQVWECLKQHMNDLNQPCKEHLNHKEQTGHHHDAEEGSTHT